MKKDPLTFRAAVLFNLKQPLEILEVLRPELLPGQVLVKIFYAGLCHSQLMEVMGARGNDAYLPHMLGHEGVGEIVEIGKNVTKVKMGDPVVMSWIKGSGANVNSTKYDTTDGIEINAGAVTTFSEYAVISENRCVKLPKDIPFNMGALLGCAIPTGAGILFNLLNPTPGKNIAIFGLGGIGLSAFLATRLFNPHFLITVDIDDEKLKLTKTLGATHCIHAGQSDPVAEIMKITDGLGVDYAIEAAGLTKTIEQAFLAVKKQTGHCVFASHPPSGDKIELDPHHFISGKKITGTWGGECELDRDVAIFSDFYKKKKLPLEVLISKEYALSYINQALNDLLNKKIVRGLIKMHC